MKSRCYCPQCNAELEYDDALCGKKIFQCPDCNATFRVETEDEHPQLGADEKLCQFCGNVIKIDELICQHCQKYQIYYCDCTCPACNGKIQVADTELEQNCICPECGKEILPVCNEVAQLCSHCQKIFFIKNDSENHGIMRCPYCRRITIKPQRELSPKQNNAEKLFSTIPARLIQPRYRVRRSRWSRVFVCCYLTGLLGIACYAELPKSKHAFRDIFNEMREISSVSELINRWRNYPNRFWDLAQYNMRRSMLFDIGIISRDISIAVGWGKKAARPISFQVQKLCSRAKTFFKKRPEEMTLEEQFRMASEAYSLEDDLTDSNSSSYSSGSYSSGSYSSGSYFSNGHSSGRSSRNRSSGGGNVTLNLDRSRFAPPPRPPRPPHPERYHREDPPPHPKQTLMIKRVQRVRYETD